MIEIRGFGTATAIRLYENWACAEYRFSYCACALTASFATPRRHYFDSHTRICAAPLRKRG